MKIIKSFFSVCILLSANVYANNQTKINSDSLVDYGVEFNCDKENIKEIKDSLFDLSKELEISEFIKIKENGSKLKIYLSKQYTSGSNLNIEKNPIFKIEKESVLIPTNEGDKKVYVTSKKEIILSLLSPGRLTKFKTKAECQPNALKEHIEIRQNVVLWSQKLEWVWPDGESAFWNKKYWIKGTPILSENNKVEDLVLASKDMFLNQKLYGIGCYTASKAVYLQAMLDYYHRVNPNKEKLGLVVNELLSDNDPLVNIEPEKMWYFEEGFNKKNPKEGKILKLQNNVYPGNFVPGDWSYIRNTDNKTNKKIGYEGSNAIYLGGNLFDDYYKDHEHGYPYERKLDEVYQWRNGVFSRSKDEEKIKPLSVEQRFKLNLPPKNGGLVESYRVVPKVF